METGMYNQAIRDFDRAIEIEPENSEAFCKRGQAKSSLGLYPDAIGDFDRAIKIAPEFSMAYYHRGAAKIASGVRQAGIEDYRAAARLGFTDALEWLEAEGIGN